MNYQDCAVVALPRAHLAHVPADREVAAMRAFPPLEPCDLTRFGAIAEAAAPLDPVDFLELTARVTRGEIQATLIREDGSAWRLSSARRRVVRRGQVAA